MNENVEDQEEIMEMEGIVENAESAENIDPKNMELELVAQAREGSFVSNLEIIKTNVAIMMKPYNAIEVTSDNLVVAKKNLATIRKMKSTMVAIKKEAIANYNKPVVVFNDRFETFMEDILKAETKLDAGVKKAQKEELAGLLEERRDLFKSSIEKEEDLEIRAYIKKCNSWLIPKEWYKKTVTLKSITEYIETTIASIKTAYTAFKGHTFEEELLKQFATTGDFNATFSMMQQKDQDYRKMIERQRVEADRLAAIEEEKQARMLATRKAAEAEAQRKAILDERISQTKMPTHEEIQAQQQASLKKVQDQIAMQHQIEAEQAEQRKEAQYQQIAPESPQVDPATIGNDKTVEFIDIPSIQVPTDPAMLKAFKVGMLFDGPRWKLQAVLDMAAQIGLKRTKIELKKEGK